MNERVKATPKEFFLNLAVFTMLYVVVYDFILIVFNCINYFVPDVPDRLFGGEVNAYSVRWEIAMLTVSFAVLLIVSVILGKVYSAEPERQKARVRQWLLYLTLFVTGATMAVIVVLNIFGILMGELTLPLALKSAVVFAVSGAVFEYHRKIGRESATMTPWSSRAFTGVSTCLVVLAISAGIYIAGSPYQERGVRLDQKTVNGLASAEDLVIRYWKEKKKLPENLNEVEFDVYNYARAQEWVKEYEYKVLGKEKFSLCAEFKTSNKQEAEVKRYGLDKWAHDAGKTCFERTVK